MKKTIKLLTRIENLVMFITFALMVVCSFAQVVNRNIFKFPISWFDEASTYCMIYMALVGTEVGLRDGTQIAVTALTDKLKGTAHKVLKIMSQVVVLAFSSAIFISAVKMMNKQIETGQTSPALSIPMSVPYAALVISFAMIVLVQVVETIQIVFSSENSKADGKEVTQ